MSEIRLRYIECKTNALPTILSFQLGLWPFLSLDLTLLYFSAAIFPPSMTSLTGALKRIHSSMYISLHIIVLIRLFFYYTMCFPPRLLYFNGICPFADLSVIYNTIKIQCTMLHIYIYLLMDFSCFNGQC